MWEAQPGISGRSASARCNGKRHFVIHEEFGAASTFLRLGATMLGRNAPALAAILGLLVPPASAFDGFWHSAATSAATRHSGFTDDSTNIVQFGNFSGPDYFGPLFDVGLGKPLETLGDLGQAKPKARQTLQDFDTFRRGQPLSVARKYAIFLHFDNLHQELDANWKFDYLFHRLLENTRAGIRSFHQRSDIGERRRKVLILMSLGISLHMVQDFYSHSDWVHHDFPKMGMPLVRLPWGKDRAPTWFEVRARRGNPAGWPFVVRTGIYPPPAGNSPQSHARMNHDNSQLFHDGATQIPYHKAGPVPATDEASAREHQLFAVNTAAGAGIEWIEKLMEDSEVRAAIQFARNIRLTRTDPMVPFLTSALGSTLFLSCVAGTWDGSRPPARRQNECRGIYTSLIATGGLAAPLPPVTGKVGAGMAPTPQNEFWAMHVQYNLVMNAAGGFGGQDGHYIFDAPWLKARYP